MVAFHTYSAQNNYSGDYSFFKELYYRNMLVTIKVLCASNIEKKNNNSELHFARLLLLMQRNPALPPLYIKKKNLKIFKL